MLRALVEPARREARVPVGFMASITKGLAGTSSPRWPSCATPARWASPTTASPSSAPAMLQKALQYQRLVGGVLALHEEDPSLTGDGRHARGRGLRAPRPRRHPVDLRVDDDRPRRRDRRVRGRPHPHPAPERHGVGAGGRARPRPAACRSPARRARTTSRSPHEVLLEKLDTRCKMNPPLRTEDDRQALIAGPARRDRRLHRHRPRAARAGGEGGAVRAGADGDDRAGDLLRRGLHRAGAAGRPAAGAGRRQARARRGADRTCRCRGSRSARRPTSACSTSTRSGRSARPATSRGRRTLLRRARAEGRRCS